MLRIMCHGAHANDTIETYNGCDGASFVSGLAAQGQPGMWSEDEQWFDRFEQGASVRVTNSVGYGVAKFVAAGGSMHNFYMFTAEPCGATGARRFVARD